MESIKKTWTNPSISIISNNAIEGGTQPDQYEKTVTVVHHTKHGNITNPATS